MKIIKCILLLLAPMCALAGQMDHQANIYDIQQKVTDSLTAYADQEEECMNNKKVLPVQDVKSVGLTESDLKDALEYFYIKNIVECTRVQADQLIVNYQVQLLVSPQKDKEIIATSKLILGDRIKLLELKRRYSRISQIQRDLIESISGVNQPIDLIATAKALGI